MANGLLASQRGHDLGRGVELDSEAVAVKAGRRLAELFRALVARVLVRSGIAGSGGKRLDDGPGGRQVGVADPEADHVDPFAPLLHDLPLELCE